MKNSDRVLHIELEKRVFVTQNARLFLMMLTDNKCTQKSSKSCIELHKNARFHIKIFSDII